MVSATCILDKSRWKKTVPCDLCAHLSYSASAGDAASLFARSTAGGSSSLGTIEGAIGAAMLWDSFEGYRSIMGALLQPRRKVVETSPRVVTHKKVREGWSQHVTWGPLSCGLATGCGDLLTSEASAIPAIHIICTMDSNAFHLSGLPRLCRSQLCTPGRMAAIASNWLLNCIPKY